ncbi:Type 1 glutamine amidotransferase-like domain-containing protein [Bacillus sp. ISL-47]|uniref:Type 1 glutamine amidotransferase-like domain-containing protein n=1 Tax=Bacillus sp. ISL-47 TaxID=2819130 RepID=UPI001BE75ADB|nr:Type 1 glutamine amidotransferase-like domain-containing protein [Bacillus sp. ISL-47]MBT2688962.1 Type 1 glutamine amidotransferase-like domain-containing protein [Bacillus sp. ISL-47]MBT2708759.1 Type 1 glutamine amidotransferase-like domain-containing protein [Pseudomonas sp. ISL-84]
MSDRHLFLMGGSPPFGEISGRKFAELSSASTNKVAVLFLEREGWINYMDKYTRPLKQYGVKDCTYLPLSSSSSASLFEELLCCSGIIIGGGETEKYRSFIAETGLGECIRKMYWEGIPVAGFSAGALICPEHCIIPPVDTPKKQHLFLNGLGLIRDCAISVHFTKWNERENLKAAMKRTGASVGYGIDDGAGIYFTNEIPAFKDGSIHTYKKI